MFTMWVRSFWNRPLKCLPKTDAISAASTPLTAQRGREECGGHCMRKAATGHRRAGIAGDTRSDTENVQSNRHSHRSDLKPERGNARAKGKYVK